MHYTKVVIVNQKSYLDTSIITLERGINLIVGKNNSGKTTLLEILSGKIDSVPHLSEEKKQRKEAKVDTPQIAAGIEFFVSKEELKVIAEDISYGKTLYFSNDENSERVFHYGEIHEFGEDTWYYYDYSNFDYEFYDPEFEPEKIEISGDEVNSYFEQLIENGLRLKVFLPSLESKVEGFHKKIVRNSGNICTVGIDFHLEGFIAKYSKSVSAEYEVSKLVSKEFLGKRVYKFDIHRVVQAKNGANELGLSLNTDCRNLPSALNYLKGDPPKYQELENLVKEVFPEINIISISQEDGATIKIWLPQTTRADLAINLSACGTGVGQVIAMLYVVVNSHTSQVIIIDEPNSFLHPSASRKLIEIFKRYDQHQYIISTHSPEGAEAICPPIFHDK